MAVSAILIYRDRDSDLNIVEMVRSDQELSKTLWKLDDFDNSLNFAFGVVDSTFDNTNNPYIEFIAYTLEYTSGNEIFKKEMDIHECTN